MFALHLRKSKLIGQFTVSTIFSDAGCFCDVTWVKNDVLVLISFLFNSFLWIILLIRGLKDMLFKYMRHMLLEC